MSDTAISSIVTGLITIAGMFIGFMTLWVKLRYGVIKAEEMAGKVASVEEKIDANTKLTHDVKHTTEEVKEASVKVGEHTTACNERMALLEQTTQDHGARIMALESHITAIQGSIDLVANSLSSVTKDISSTRHDLRTHLQTITTKLDIMAMQQTKKEDA